MALNIKDETTHALVRHLAAKTGESQTEAVRRAVEERLKRQESGTAGPGLAARLDEIALHCAALPEKRARSDDDILGYNERGIPG